MFVKLLEFSLAPPRHTIRYFSSFHSCPWCAIHLKCWFREAASPLFVFILISFIWRGGYVEVMHYSQLVPSLCADVSSGKLRSVSEWSHWLLVHSLCTPVVCRNVTGQISSRVLNRVEFSPWLKDDAKNTILQSERNVSQRFFIQPSCRSPNASPWASFFFDDVTVADVKNINNEHFHTIEE